MRLHGAGHGYRIFHYANTTDRTLKVASELIKAGVKPAEITEAIYNNYPWSRIELMGKVLATVKRDENGPCRHGCVKRCR